MSLFSVLYDRTLRWARHRHAPWFLAGLSFAESSFFPVPPDVMLVPMSLARVERAWRFALIATFASVIGGVFGYLIGQFAFQFAETVIRETGYWDYYQQAHDWFDQWGVWIIFIAGFSPIPYKIFTITAGSVAMPLIPFIIASFIGRGGRFFLVAGLIYWGGEKMERFLRSYIDRIGWAVVVGAIGLYVTLH